MPLSSTAPESRFHQFRRASIEVGFIVFLFYANLLMGEFTASAGRGKSVMAALRDVITPANFLIAIIAAIIGHGVFEYLRRQL